MNVLFKNIPIGTRDHELAEFIKLNFNNGNFENKGLALPSSGINMMELQDNYTRPIEQFGIVRISSAFVAKEIIKQLNGFIYKKYKITVRQFYTRSASNDPRVNTIDIPKDIVEQRKKDRRELALVYSRRV